MPATWMRTPLGGFEPGGGAVEVLAARDQPPGQHAVADDLGVAVDVGEERLQRPHALDDPALQLATTPRR